MNSLGHSIYGFLVALFYTSPTCRLVALKGSSSAISLDFSDSVQAVTVVLNDEIHCNLIQFYVMKSNLKLFIAQLKRSVDHSEVKFQVKHKPIG
jgi:hypothetical protein